MFIPNEMIVSRALVAAYQLICGFHYRLNNNHRICGAHIEKAWLEACV